MKAIIFDSCFEAPEELINFCKELGYEINNGFNRFDIMFDNRVVEFCEKRLSPLWDERVYKGKESYKFRVGFAGAGYIRDIDTTKKWVIEYNHVDSPIIKYVYINVNKYGYVSMIKSE